MKPYQFQEEDIEWLAGRNEALLANDCGLGKTLTAVEFGKRYATGPILVVAPRLTKEQWKETIEEQKAGYIGVCEAAGRGIPWSRVQGWGSRKPLLWVVVHPAAVRMSYREMTDVPWDLVIVDEAHRFKNRNAKQTRALWKIKAERKLLLTATPYGKSPADMWALLHYMKPDSYSSYWRFFDRYVDYYKPHGQHWRIIRGSRNLQDLAREIQPLYRKRKKDDVLDLPQLIRTDITVLLGEEQEALYLKLAKEAYAELHGREVILENALVRFLRLQQCALDPSLLANELPMFPIGEVPAKVKWLQEWLEDHPDEKVVITSRYRKFVEKWLVDLAPNATIVGGMSESEVSRARKNFESNGKLVGSLDAIKEGLNLQTASTMIITDGSYSSVAEYQLSNRIHRPGQTKRAQVIHLVGKLRYRNSWTVDKLMRRAVESKFSQAELLDKFVRELET